MPDTKKIEKPLESKKELSQNDITDLITIVSTHPTPEGIGSANGLRKAELVQTLQALRE